MGNDGGSIPGRTELVKEQKRVAQETIATARNAEEYAVQRFCALSKRALAEPVVSCGLGRLYNKETVIEYLLAEANGGGGGGSNGSNEAMQHVRSMKDFVTLQLTWNRARRSDDDGLFICPITQREMNGSGGRFVYLVPCGHVFSDSAVRRFISDEACMRCSTAFKSERDIIAINSREADVLARLAKRLKELEADGLTHSLMPNKKKKRPANNEIPATGKLRLVSLESTKPSMRQHTAGGTMAKSISKSLDSAPERSDVFKRIFTTS